MRSLATKENRKQKEENTIHTNTTFKKTKLTKLQANKSKYEEKG